MFESDLDLDLDLFWATAFFAFCWFDTRQRVFGAIHMFRERK